MKTGQLHNERWTSVQTGLNKEVMRTYKTETRKQWRERRFKVQMDMHEDTKDTPITYSSLQLEIAKPQSRPGPSQIPAMAPPNERGVSLSS